MQFPGLHVPNFYPFRSMISCCQDKTYIFVYFEIFALTPMLKFQSATKVLKIVLLLKKVHYVIACILPW